MRWSAENASSLVGGVMETFIIGVIALLQVLEFAGAMAVLVLVVVYEHMQRTGKILVMRYRLAVILLVLPLVGGVAALFLLALAVVVGAWLNAVTHLAVLAVLAYVIFRNKPPRKRRRRRGIMSVIKEAGAKLKVMPVPAPSPA
jgi:hypothetical protein